MRRNVPRLPKGRRMHFRLEILESRLPVSESIGAALAVSGLARLGLAFERVAALGSSPNSAPESPSGLEHATGPTVRLGSALSGTAYRHLNALKTTSIDAALVDLKSVAEGTKADVGLIKSTAGAPREGARLNHGQIRALGSQAGQARGGSMISGGTSQAAPSPARATARGASTTTTAAAPQALSASFLPTVNSPGANQTIAVPSNQSGGATAAQAAISAPATNTAQTAPSTISTQQSSPRPPGLGPAAPVLLGQQPGAPDTTQFHGDAARMGFNQNETVLTPTNVASSFGQVWESPVLDGHLYASPLYQDNLTIQGNGNAANHAGDGVQSASFQGKTLGVVLAATGGGTVYAVAAEDTNGPTGIAPGTVLWKTHLGNPYGGIDGNSIGVLSTPIIDIKSNRIYVTASVTDYLLPAGNPNHGKNNWEVFALNLNDGSLVSGWPVAYTQSQLDSLNQNTLNGGNAVPFSSGGADQRGALNLSPDGSTLYVDFACYGASNPGWMTSVATGVTSGASNGQTPAVMSAYSATDSTSTNANGGMWGAGGPVVDASGNVFVSTGDSPNGTGQTPGAWGNSVLEWAPGQTLKLIGAYTPWNYQTQDTIDSDLGGGSPVLIQLPAGSSTTTELLAVGGKQGNGYLVDAGNNLNDPTKNPNNSPATYPSSLTSRPPVVTPNQDPSLYDPNAIRSYFSPPQAGPLALFGPYNETSASGNTAKARDTPATFVGPDGNSYVIWAGSSKSAVGSGTPVAPSLYLTKVATAPGQPAFLSITAQNTQVMSLPGANIITANGTVTPIDWVVDAGVQRTDGETSFANGAPTLYAYNALTLQPLWSSAYEQLDMGGKYNTITAARGDLFVGTDRIQAFGLTTDTIIDDSVIGTGPNQFNYAGSGWSHTPAGSSTATMGTFDGTVSTDNVSGDSATLTFAGSQIKVYADEASGYGSATISVDGGNAQTISLANSTNSPNSKGEGDVLVYTLASLGAGNHTLKFLNNSSSTVALDRVEITPLTSAAAIGVSLTEGNVTPTPGKVLPYTINYNNAGSLVGGTGNNASGVVLTETVPANTSADLANSTPGWTLTSGSGGVGSTYTFAIGALNAGVTGSVVFSVDVNSTIPAGTANLTNTVNISDAASDHGSGTRVTPLGTPVATTLGFAQQPGIGESGVALTPAVTVAVLDQFGNTFTGDSSSTVTLTLNGGTFAGGGNTATATVSNGVATFSNLVIGSAGSYTLTASDGSLTGATSSTFTIRTAAKLGFTQQPGNGNTGVALSPAVAVAVEDASGNTVGDDSSIVTLTLSSGTFSGGGNTATATAVNGVATFGNLIINTAGSYTMTATDGSLTGATSSSFTISSGTSIFDDFNTAATDFTSNFTEYNNGGANNTSLAWGAGFGVQDQAGPAAGGGVESTGGVAIDSTSVYTPAKVNLSDGLVHTMSGYVTAVTGLGAGDKPLQIGFLAPSSTGFNAGFSFISARILGNNTVVFQSDNGGGAVSIDNTKPTGTINTGDWLQLVFTTQETASGSFKGTFSLIDYGPTGVGAGTTVLAPVSYTVSGLTNLGTASAVSPGFRTATNSGFTGHVQFDNFAVDPAPMTPAKLAYLQQPSSGTAGVPLSPFVVAVQDITGHTVTTDSSTVTLTLSHGTFADGTTSVSATAVNGVATFSNLVIDAAGSYILRATDSNPNLDPGYGPFTINGTTQASASLLGTDTTTQGNWRSAYGHDGYDIEGDTGTPNPNLPSYATVSLAGAYTYTWGTNTGSPYALQNVVQNGDIASTWFSATSFDINLNLTDGQAHRVSLYALDWDQLQGWNVPRSERIDVLDATTGTVLATQTISSFRGDYVSFSIQGSVDIRVTNLVAGNNAVVGGIFFGAASSSNSASFVGTDATTQGHWRTAYGGDGYDIEGDSSGTNPSLPSYATVSVTGNYTYTWGTNTGSPYALQNAAGNGDIAATWFSPSSFNINVGINDGKSHLVTLYALDWDQLQGWNVPRSERIDILNAATGTVLDTRTLSSFQGEYVSWNISGNVTIRVTNLVAGNNAVVGGIFFGGAAGK